MQISLEVSQASNKEKALQLLEESKKNCLVTNILNVEKTYHFDVT